MSNTIPVSAVQEVAVQAAKDSNEILKGYLIKALEATGNVVDKAVDMVQTQAPILVQEVLHWYFAYYLIMFILAIVGLIAMIVIDKKIYKWAQGDIDRIFFSCMLGGIVNLVAFAFLIHNLNLQWLKIYIAPRLWLIEYAASLVK